VRATHSASSDHFVVFGDGGFHGDLQVREGRGERFPEWQEFGGSAQSTSGIAGETINECFRREQLSNDGLVLFVPDLFEPAICQNFFGKAHNIESREAPAKDDSVQLRHGAS
jgi:hypothetical protein